MIHRGEIVEKVIREEAYSITKLAGKLGRSRRHIYNMFENNKLNWDVIEKIGEIINYDFSKKFDELKHRKRQAADIEFNYLTVKRSYTFEECIEELDFWKKRYIELMEKYSALLQSKLDAVEQPAKKGKSK